MHRRCRPGLVFDPAAAAERSLPGRVGGAGAGSCGCRRHGARLGPAEAVAGAAARVRHRQKVSKFAAIYLMLKTPGGHPWVDTGFGRLAPLGKLDDFRDNWWGSFDPSRANRLAITVTHARNIPWRCQTVSQSGAARAAFLPESDCAQAAREARLAALPPAPNYLAAQVRAT